MAITEPENPLVTRLLLCCMLAGEALAVQALLLEQAPLAGASHAVAALGAAWAARHALGAGRGWLASMTAAALVLSLPVAGALGFAFVVLPAWRRVTPTPRGGRVEMELVAPAPSQADEGHADTSPIRSVLSNTTSVPARTDAVMALRRMNARHAVPLLRLAFSDPNEDVRLLAFAILDRREKQLRLQIQLGLRRLESAAIELGKSERAALHRRIARDHWELVYGGFVSGDVEAALLESARQYATLALDLKFDGATSVLLARIQLRQKQPAAAWASLERAEHAGVARAACAPLFAEAAFALRRFGEIPGLLSRLSASQIRRAELAPIVAFWAGVKSW